MALNEIILSSDTLNQGRIKINNIFSGTSAIWSSGTGSNSVIRSNANEDFGNIALANYSFAAGMYNSASGTHSITLWGSGNSASSTFSFAGGNKNSATTTSATAIGGQQNLASGMFSFVSGLVNSGTTTGSLSIGGQQNIVSSGYYSTGEYAAIVGSNSSTASGDYSLVGGGTLNLALNSNDSVIGGQSNWALGGWSSVIGGISNRASGQTSAVVCGQSNKVSGENSFIGGGTENQSSGINSSIIGGSGNTSFGTLSSVIGGILNYATGNTSAIVCGSGNTSSGGYSFIGGGVSNTTLDISNFIGGGSGNTTTATNSAVICGHSNSALATNSFIAGGSGNKVSSTSATIIGGASNIITGSCSTSFIGGGSTNQVNGIYSAVIGSRGCLANHDFSFALGGGSQTRADFDFVLGATNTAVPDVSQNTIRLEGTGGNIKIDGSVSSPEADYSEYFEYEDGNLNNEDRRGYFVSLIDDKIKIGNQNVIGIISVTPTIIGDSAPNHWSKMNMKDIWGATIYDEYIQYTWLDDNNETKIVFKNDKQQLFSEYPHASFPAGIIYNGTIPEITQTKTFTAPKINPDFDPSTPYIDRSSRQEWAPVGLLGKLFVRTAESIISKFVDVNSNGMAINGTKYPVLNTVREFTDNEFGIVRVFFK